MASQFCFSIQLLSLITFGQLATGAVSNYRSRTLGPYSPQAATLPRSYGPVRSSYESSLWPRGSAPSLKFPGSLSAEVSKQWGSVPSQSESGYSRQVNSYSQPRSVSSYNSASGPQQSKATLQRTSDMREPSQGANRYGSSIVSSGAIVIHAAPPLLASSPGKNVNSPASAPQIPSQHPAFSAPAVLQTKADMWDSVNLQSAKAPASGPQRPSQHPAFSAPAVLQTKADMWDSVNLQSAKSPAPAPQRLSQHPAVLPPAVLQSKDMWRSAYSQSAKSPDSTANRYQHSLSVPAELQTRHGQLAGIYTSTAQSPDKTAQRHQKPYRFLAPTVLQTKQTWGSRSSPDSRHLTAANPRSSEPVAPGNSPSGLHSGLHATQQQATLLARQPQLGSVASRVLQNKAVGTNLQMKPFSRNSRPVNAPSLYNHGSWQPQLSYNRNR